MSCEDYDCCGCCPCRYVVFAWMYFYGDCNRDLFGSDSLSGETITTANPSGTILQHTGDAGFECVEDLYFEQIGSIEMNEGNSFNFGSELLDDCPGCTEIALNTQVQVINVGRPIIVNSEAVGAGLGGDPPTSPDGEAGPDRWLGGTPFTDVLGSGFDVTVECPEVGSMGFSLKQRILSKIKSNIKIVNENGIEITNGKKLAQRQAMRRLRNSSVRKPCNCKKNNGTQI